MTILKLKQPLQLFLLLIYISFGTLYAQNGTLDLAFGNNGLVTTTTGEDQEVFYSIIEVDNNKVLAAGGANYIATLIRYNQDGSIDTSFGTNGILELDFGGTREEIEDMIRQPDGKILITAESKNTNDDYDFIVARLNEDGSYDTSFGNNGISVISYGSSTDERPNAITLAPDGKIIVAGNTEGGLIWQTAIARLNADGSLDTSFSNDGKQNLSITNRSDYLNGVEVTFDGKIIAAGGGVFNSGSNQGRMAIVRYLDNGELDPSFGVNGTVTLNVLDASCIGESLISLPDGKSLIAGYANGIGIQRSFAIIRLDINGDLDPTFGTNGSVVTVVPSVLAQIFKIKLDENNSIFAVGESAISGQAVDFTIAKYSYDGQIDTNFGTNGIATTDFFGVHDRAWDFIIHDNQLTVAGFTMQASPDEDFALARYDLDDNLGLSEHSKKGNFEISPTVTNSIITIKSLTNSKNATVSVIDITGKVVYNETIEINQTPKSIHLERFDSGLYIVKINTDSQVETHKIILK